MMYRCEFTPKDQAALCKLARKSPKAIVRKIEWLVEYADNIASPFFSLHSGPFRIPYLLDTVDRRIIIDDIAQHGAAYGRINKLS